MFHFLPLLLGGGGGGGGVLPVTRLLTTIVLSLVLHHNNKKKHICVDISTHGFGHLAQTVAVLNELNSNEIHLTIRSSEASLPILHERLHPNFVSCMNHIPYEQDTGMIMKDALQVDISKTMDWYRSFHNNPSSSYQQKIQQATSDLNDLQPDLLFCNIPYLSLQATASLKQQQQQQRSQRSHAFLSGGVVALCSLNWADIFQSYCGKEVGADQIYQDMLHAYSNVDLFLQPTPSMPMTNLYCLTKYIGPIVLSGGKSIKNPSLTQIVYNSTGHYFRYFVLVGVGGMVINNLPLNDDKTSWPQLIDTCWIVPDAMLLQATTRSTQQAAGSTTTQRQDFVAQSVIESHCSYIDLIASVDCILTKTGYGTQTEAVIYQIPTLCIERHDWPEHIYLKQWHQKHGIVSFCDWNDIIGSSSSSSSTNTFLADTISELIQKKKNQQRRDNNGKILIPPQPTGAKEAALILEQRLGLT